MKRRDVLKNLILTSGAMLSLPAWAIGWKPEVMGRYNTTFTDYEISIIASIVDTVIPTNGEIGGISVGVDKFLVGLISRCYDKEFQGAIRANLYELDDRSKTDLGSSFSECKKADRETLFLGLNKNDNENDEDFFNFMKSETIRGFETSEEVMMNYHGFVLMPGFYDGNVNVEA